MSEDMIERTVERSMDSLDRRYMAGKLSESEYNNEIKKLDNWAKREYKKVRR